jgi:hypothetical protein
MKRCAVVELFYHDLTKFKGLKSSCSATATGRKKPNVVKLSPGVCDHTLAKYPSVLGPDKRLKPMPIFGG